ncbi:cupin domain-containing protein [Streptomyces asiaticus]|uniref:cupin domain-containing protein n=1 Tax=Streptomyces asiaticus TaxID=114695 RepID=UPI003D71E9BC
MSTAAMLEPGAGRKIAGGALQATLKVPGGAGALTSTFEVVVPPGYDVGAHVHTTGEELFYVVDGELDLLAFEPVARTEGDWHTWRTASGRRYMRGGPGSLMFVPAGCPHAFANQTGRPATMLFQSAPSGHENYFEELAALLRAGDRPDPEDIAELRRRYDIEQLTPLRGGSGPSPFPHT